jgi:hypothetical protein
VKTLLLLQKKTQILQKKKQKDFSPVVHDLRRNAPKRHRIHKVFASGFRKERFFLSRLT